MKTIIKTLLWILILSTPLLITSEAKAFGGHHSRSDGTSNKAPIDGGITLLAAAGIGLGIKKMRSRRESSKENDSNI